ncbi:hypothetical protein GNF67_19675, partial [Clostridium perfringens]|nr:hypothetical protein [Clostridium perfringens]
PEYNNIEKAKEILSLINDKDSLIDLIEPGNDITIRIGEENYFPEAKDCSIISSSFSLSFFSSKISSTISSEDSSVSASTVEFISSFFSVSIASSFKSSLTSLLSSTTTPHLFYSII